MLDHFRKNTHHAYLIEGEKETVLPEIFKYLESADFPTPGSADFYQVSVDAFKIEDARNLKAQSSERNVSGKRVFVISANSFLLEAQNTLLKIFEEPVESTVFFLVVPDRNSLLKTLVSRFYFISAKQAPNSKDAEQFLKMALPERIEFIKELLAEEEDEEAQAESPRARSNDFLNSLESVLHRKLLSKTPYLTEAFDHFFKVREMFRMPGSSAKNLMESVALIVPKL